MKKVRRVYLDYAAATPVAASVQAAMAPFFKSEFGNPSALYQEAREARAAVEDSRAAVAGALHTTPAAIIFTSGGTEANNLAILGSARVAGKRRHIIISAIEHHSVLEPALGLERQGFKVSVIPVSVAGVIQPESVLAAVNKDTALISLMHANNEVGSRQPIAEIGRRLRQWRQKSNSAYPYFHTDACQAAWWYELPVDKLHVDLLTLTASKLYGPKGAGVLYVRPGTNLSPLVYGGTQERSRRPGTENVPGIVGFGAAIKEALRGQPARRRRAAALAQLFFKALQRRIPGCRLNGPPLGEERLPNNLSVTFPNIDGETLLLYLDRHGIACATGSACSTDSLDPSHVLQALALPPDLARRTLRFSLGSGTTRADIAYAVKAIVSCYSTMAAPFKGS